jgi:hypothetical protein
MRDTSVLSRIGSAFTRPFSARSKIHPDTKQKTRMDIDHIAVCDEEGLKEFNKRYGIDLGEGIRESYIPYIIDNDKYNITEMYRLIKHMNIGELYTDNLRNIDKENLQNIYQINYILKEVDNEITNSDDIDKIDILSEFIDDFTEKLKDKIRYTIIQKTKDMDLSDKKEYVIKIKQILKKICAIHVENLLKDIKLGGKPTKKSAKKHSAKKSSKKHSAKKRSAKKSSKKRSAKKSSKKRSAKKSSKKRSAKKSSKKRSAKKSSKKRSAKKSVKKAFKKRSTKKSSKKRSAKKSSKKRSTKKSTKKRSKKRSTKKRSTKKRSAKKSISKKW